MSQGNSASTHIPWPPLIAAGCAAAALVLHAVYPLPWLGSPGRDILFAIGLILAVAGIVIAIAAVRRLRRPRIWSLTAPSPSRATRSISAMSS